VSTEQRKSASSAAVPLADASTLAASAAPIPAPALGSKPAPGQTGPKGLAPRTNYSRVNTGAPPVADVTSQQKTLPPDPMGTLAKAAHQEDFSMPQATPRKTIQDMVKAASEGAASAAAVNREVLSQIAGGGEEKVASAPPPRPDTVSTDYATKLAAALEYIIETDKQAEEASNEGVGPGQGPNALEVNKAESSEKNVDAGDMGQATGAHQPPMNPGTQTDPSRKSDPGTGLETNDTMMHGEQPVKVSAPLSLIRKVASGGQTGLNAAVVEAALALRKQAEDAINPAQISAGSEVPPDTSAAGESGGAPAGGLPEGSTSLVGSNESAINYTKGEAKSKAKADAAKVLTEPVLSSSTDSTLQKTLDHTGEAGVKISGPVKTAAARALLEKFAADAEAKAKKKSATGGMGTYQAPPVGGAAGTPM
jgi:hypothetical protein